MGYSRKISRIGKTKKEKEAVKLIKSADREIQKKSQPKKKLIKSADAEIQKQSQPKKKPVKALEKKTQNSSAKSKYVTQGMVDYVTLLRSRKSGHKLREETMDIA